MDSVFQYKSFDLQVKDIDTRQGIVTGYFASFDTIDSDGDVFVKGAFSNSINQRFNRIKHLLDHDTTKAVGKIQLLSEDNTGLYYESKIGSHAIGKDFLAMVESGLITEHSVGFRLVKGKVEIKDGIRTLKEVKLFEGSSLQTWGANEHTPLMGIKSMYSDADRIAKRMRAIELYCKNSEAQDEVIESLLIELKQLAQLYIDSTTKSIEPVITATQPEILDMKAVAIALNL